jgi:hypothetical protein
MLRRLLLWIVIVAAIYAVHALFSPAEFEGPRRPLPPSAEPVWSNTRAANPPTGQTPRVPTFELWIEERGEVGDAIGTAFMVMPGLWVTAAHVLSGCATGYLRVQDRWRRIAQWTLHPVADVAVAKTDGSDWPPSVPITDRLPVLDQQGFHFGFPQGRPASIYTRFIGLARIRQGRPGTPIEQGWVWAEQGRTPAGTGPLGGLSGGPQVDRTGATQGVTVLHSERAARLSTAPVFRTWDVLPKDVPKVSSGGTTIDPRDYATQGEHVRGIGSVALVFCSRTGRTRPRGS